MAGLNVGTSNWGSFRGSPEIPIPKPEPSPEGRRMGRRRGAIDTTPKNPPVPMGGGMNVGRTSNLGILPSDMDPFRTYGTVSGGRMTPPSNPYGQNQPIRWTPGGEWGSPSIPNLTPMNIPGLTPGPVAPPESPNPWLERGGFTGQGPNPTGNIDTAPTNYTNPAITGVPDMRQRQGMGNPMDQFGQNRLRRLYGNVGPGLSNRPFRSSLFY